MANRFKDIAVLLSKMELLKYLIDEIQNDPAFGSGAVGAINSLKGFNISFATNLATLRLNLEIEKKNLINEGGKP